MRYLYIPGSLQMGGQTFVYPTNTFPLDLVGSATGAWSLRKLAAAYAGSCIRVQRTSDSTEQDIGFVDDHIDTDALISFCGTSDGRIATWYDQSGNARNLTQTGTSQPFIVVGGTVVTSFGQRPALDFTNDRFLTSAVNADSFISTTAGAIFTVFNADDVVGTTAPAGDHLWCQSGGNAGMTIQPGMVCSSYVFTSSFLLAETSGLAVATSYVAVWWRNATQLKNFVNTDVPSQTTTVGTGSALTSPLRVGQQGTGTGGTLYDGKLGEIICYITSLSDADIQTVGDAMASPHGITWV